MTTFAERAVPFTNCFNVRDMGGWRTEDGRRVRWRTLYRGDTLHHLDGEELEVLAGLGLRTVIDLRTENELEQRGRFRPATQELRHLHIPLIDEAGPSAARPANTLRTLGDGYISMATGARGPICRAVSALAEPGGLPGLFHCTAGKDRTGIVAAIVLSVVGVVDEDILADYALTAESRAARYDWLAVHDPDYLAFLQSLPPGALEVRAEAIEAMLDRLRTDHGSVADYLTAGGVSPEAIERLGDALLEG